MNKHFFAFILFIFTLPASAVESLHFAIPYQASGPQLQKIPSAVLNNIRGTALIDASSKCSAIIVSNAGHAITALHCLREMSNYAYEHPFLNLPKATSEERKKGVLFTVREEKLPLKMNLDVANINYLWPSSTPPQEVEVLLLGKAYNAIYPLLEFASKDVLKKIHDTVDDFAVIKLSSIPFPSKCIQAEPWADPVGHQVWHTGYPALIDAIKSESEEKIKYEKFLELSSRGDAESFYANFPLYISSGLLFTNHAELLESYPHVGELGYADNVYNWDWFRLSSAPATGGFSGGGVFDKTGNLIGINSAMLFSYPHKFNPLTNTLESSVQKKGEFSQGVMMIKTQYIYEQIRTKLGVKKAQEIFDCQQQVIL